MSWGYWIKNHQCGTCGDKMPEEYDRHTCIKCLARQKEWHQKKSQEMKKRVLKAYGNKCACCGITETVFLCIDHINGGGRKGKLKRHASNYILPAEALYRWLIKEEFPSDFQILCWNCNSAKHYLGICPHQKLT